MMSLMRISAGICIVLCLIYQTNAKTDTDNNLSSSSYFPGSDLMMKQRVSIKYTSFVYILCDRSKSEEKWCTVTREYHTFGGYSKRVSCDLTLKYKDKDSQRIVAPLGWNKSVILSLESPVGSGQQLKFTIVHFPSCEMIEETIILPSQDKNINMRKDVNLIPYENEQFEIIFQSDSFCVNKRFCRVTFDVNGKMIAGPVGFFTNTVAGIPVYIDPFTSQSPTNEYIIYAPGRTADQFYISTNAGWRLIRDFRGTMAFGFSTSNNLISYCSQDKFSSRTNCTQMDHRLNIRFQSTPNTGNMLYGVSMCNLPSGGFLIATRTHRNKMYSIKKIDGTGRIVGAVEFLGFKCDVGGYVPYPEFFERSDGKYCLSMLCVEVNDNPDENSGIIEFASNCYAESDFLL